MSIFILVSLYKPYIYIYIYVYIGRPLLKSTRSTRSHTAASSDESTYQEHMLHLSLSLSVYTYIYIYIHIYTHTHIYAYVCMYVCVYIYIYIEIHIIHIISYILYATWTTLQTLTSASICHATQHRTILYYSHNNILPRGSITSITALH